MVLIKKPAHLARQDLLKYDSSSECFCFPFSYNDIISSVIKRNQCNNIKSCPISLIIKAAYENSRRLVFIEYWQPFKREVMSSVSEGNGLSQIHSG